jgi:hypothetical protein
MAITHERLREIFKGLENGNGAAFFELVAESVNWIVMGTHSLGQLLPHQKGIQPNSGIEKTHSKECCGRASNL